MGASQRLKGHNWEREVAKMLRPIFPEARRGLDQTREGDDPDVDKTPFWVECKSGKRPNIGAAMEQALEASLKSGDTRPALVVSKRDHCTPMATMLLSDFLDLLGAVYGQREAGMLDEPEEW